MLQKPSPTSPFPTLPLHQHWCAYHNNRGSSMPLPWLFTARPFTSSPCQTTISNHEVHFEHKSIHKLSRHKGPSSLTGTLVGGIAVSPGSSGADQPLPVCDLRGSFSGPRNSPGSFTTVRKEEVPPRAGQGRPRLFDANDVCPLGWS